jgi:hypothetical protein
VYVSREPKREDYDIRRAICRLLVSTCNIGRRSIAGYLLLAIRVLKCGEKDGIVNCTSARDL